MPWDLLRVTENNLPLDLTQGNLKSYEQQRGEKILKGIKTYLGIRRILLHFLIFVNIDNFQGPN